MEVTASPMDLDHTWMVQATSFVSFAALAMQVWELVIHVIDEVEYVWKSKMSPMKVLYIWARYGQLVAQITNLVTVQLLSLGYFSRQGCANAFLLEIFISQQAILCVEGIQLMRLFALYNQSRRVKYFLLSIFGISTGLEIAGNIATGKMYSTRAKCTMLASAPPDSGLTWFAVGAGMFQVVVLGMTLSKQLSTKHTRWARTPLSSLMMKDSLFVFFLLFVVLSTVVGYEAVWSFGPSFWNIAFGWYIALLSIAGCRLIMNMRSLALGPIHSDHEASIGASEPFYDESDR